METLVPSEDTELVSTGCSLAAVDLDDDTVEATILKVLEEARYPS